MKLAKFIELVKSGKISRFSKPHEIQALAAFCFFRFPDIPLASFEKELTTYIDFSLFTPTFTELSSKRRSKSQRRKWQQNVIYLMLLRACRSSTSEPSSAYICNKCGRAVTSKDRSRHLMQVHKLSGYNIDIHFRNMGKPYQPWMSNYLFDGDTPIRRERRELNLEGNSTLSCGTRTQNSTYVKIIYTPMGNRR